MRFTYGLTHDYLEWPALARRLFAIFRLATSRDCATHTVQILLPTSSCP